jgi:hypothetical protein
MRAPAAQTLMSTKSFDGDSTAYMWNFPTFNRKFNQFPNEASAEIDSYIHRTGYPDNDPAIFYSAPQGGQGSNMC